MTLGELSRPVPAGIDVEQVEACMPRRRPPLNFPPHIERCYEADRGATRCRLLFRTSLAGVVIYAGLVLSLRAMFADILPLMDRVFASAAPVFAALTCVFLFRPGRVVRELAVVAIVMTGVVSIGYLGVHTAAPDRWVIPQMWILPLLYITALQRLRFMYAILACALMYPVMLYLMLRLPGYTPVVYGAGTALFLAGTVYVLFGAYNTEWHQRQTYLLTLKARLQAQDLELLSKCDPLTGLGNRLLLGEALARCREQPQEQCSILLLDIDHFKALNDAAGHEAGDQCLVRVADLIQGELQGSQNRAFRYGGEEFLVLLRQAGVNEAARVAERIRSALEALGIHNPGVGSGSRVTASVGVASGDPDTRPDGEKLIAAADAALYAAKQAGRNRVFRSERGPDGVLVSVAG